MSSSEAIMKTAAIFAMVMVSAMSVGVQDAEKPAAPAQSTADVQGTWLGTLDAGGVKLRVAFAISNAASGLTATMDSLDQGTKGIPVATVSYKRPVLTMAVTIEETFSPVALNKISGWILEQAR